MANELKVMPRRFDQPIAGDKMQMQGAHFRPDSDIRVDAGNTDTYVVTKGVQYLHLIATSAIWVRVSATGASAEVGKDQFMAAGDSLEIYSIMIDADNFRPIREGDVVKCVVDS